MRLHRFYVIIHQKVGGTMNLQEIKNKLLSDYKYRIELHAHTAPVSICSEVSPKELVEIYKGQGFDAVVITNHFKYLADGADKEKYINDYVAAFEEAQKIGEEAGLKVYLGTEIRFTENSNEYLIFGVTKDMLSEIYDFLRNGIENFRKNYSMPESLFIQAHPMRNGMQSVDPSLLDGVEVFNMHPNHNSRVGLVSKYAKENGFTIITSGSDFHHKNQSHEGVSAMRCAALPKDSFELAKILKSGDYLLEVGGNNIILP